MLLDEFNRKYRVELVKTGKEEFELHTNSNPAHLLMDMVTGKNISCETTDVIVTDRDTNEVVLNREVSSENQASLLLHNVIKRDYILVTAQAETRYTNTLITEHTILPKWFYEKESIRHYIDNFSLTFYSLTFYRDSEMSTMVDTTISKKEVSELELYTAGLYVNNSSLREHLSRAVDEMEGVDNEDLLQAFKQVDEVSERVLAQFKVKQKS